MSTPRLRDPGRSLPRDRRGGAKATRRDARRNDTAGGTGRARPAGTGKPTLRSAPSCSEPAHSGVAPDQDVGKLGISSRKQLRSALSDVGRRSPAWSPTASAAVRRGHRRDCEASGTVPSDLRANPRAEERPVSDGTRRRVDSKDDRHAEARRLPLSLRHCWFGAPSDTPGEAAALRALGHDRSCLSSAQSARRTRRSSGEISWGPPRRNRESSRHGAHDRREVEMAAPRSGQVRHLLTDGGKPDVWGQAQAVSGAHTHDAG